VVACAGDLGDQRARIAEGDARADAVLAGAAAEDVRQTLAQPSLDAFGRNDDELVGEGVGQGIGQQGAEPVGEEVCELRSMDANDDAGWNYGVGVTREAVRTG